jgi:hypothetical protein
MFLPWYRDAGGGTITAWGGYWFAILMAVNGRRRQAPAHDPGMTLAR